MGARAGCARRRQSGSSRGALARASVAPTLAVLLPLSGIVCSGSPGPARFGFGLDDSPRPVCWRGAVGALLKWQTWRGFDLPQGWFVSARLLDVAVELGDQFAHVAEP